MKCIGLYVYIIKSIHNVQFNLQTNKDIGKCKYFILNTRNKKELVKAHAYITYNVKKKVVKEKYFYVIMQNSLKKSTKSGKNHGKHITNILTGNACNINMQSFI